MYTNRVHIYHDTHGRWYYVSYLADHTEDGQLDATTEATAREEVLRMADDPTTVNIVLIDPDLSDRNEEDE